MNQPAECCLKSPDRALRLLAIALGAGGEGEPFALAGGVLAHRHWLWLRAAMLAAIAGSFAVDQMWFHLSRRMRHTALVGAITRRPAFAHSLQLIARHPARFVLLNGVAAVAWGVAFTALGYAAGPMLEAAEARMAGA